MLVGVGEILVGLREHVPAEIPARIERERPLVPIMPRKRLGSPVGPESTVS